MKQKLTKLEKRWILYDVGNSAFVLLTSTIIPIYYKNVAAASGISDADSTAFFGYATSLVTILVAVLGPVLGTLADTKGFKKPVFTFFMMMGVLGCAALALPKTWVAFLAVYVLAKTGLNASLVFYDAMLSDVTTDERMDVVSAQGYAWGYIGSCVPFIISLVFVLCSELIGISGGTAMAIAFVLNAAWWLLVTLPLLASYEQKHYVERDGPSGSGTASGVWPASFRRSGKCRRSGSSSLRSSSILTGVYTHHRHGDFLRQGCGNQRYESSARPPADPGGGLPLFHPGGDFVEAALRIPR